MRSRAWIAGAVLAWIAWPGLARAGERPLEVLLVNMTPDAQSSAPSKACVRDVEARLVAAEAHVARIGETALRKLAKKTAGEPMLAWPRAAFEPARKRDGGQVDAVVLVDCRPEGQAVDVAVAPSAAGVARIELRQLAVDASVTEWLAAAILRRAWIGFSP